VRRPLVLLVLAALPGAAVAQSSQFGVRGLGLPLRPLSARTLGTAGAFGLFDPETSLNPASLGPVATVTAVFTGVQEIRHAENPAGTASLRDARFPQIGVAGPLRRFPLVLGVSYSGYSNRDFTLATADTLDIRGILVPVHDTLASRGGISDLRFAGAYRLHQGWVLGAGIHVLTGSNRVEFRRSFADPGYEPVRQLSELSYAGVGVSLGATRQLGSKLTVAALARTDGHVGLDRDSARVARVDLPYTLGLGLRAGLVPRLDLAGHAIFRTWSGANSDLLEQGGTGASNTFEVAGGGEYTTDPRRPYRRPIRFGARFATLPFPVVEGGQPREFAVAIGTGTRFAQQRGGVDLALEHVWRTEGEFKERAFLVTVGISVRP